MYLFYVCLCTYFFISVYQHTGISMCAVWRLVFLSLYCRKKFTFMHHKFMYLLTILALLMIHTYVAYFSSLFLCLFHVLLHLVVCSFQIWDIVYEQQIQLCQIKLEKCKRNSQVKSD